MTACISVVVPVGAVAGMTLPAVHTNLSMLDMKGAFVSSQEGEKGRDAVSYDEFCTCLALCGHIKYEEVGEMKLAKRVEGIVLQFLGDTTEQEVISDAIVPKLANATVRPATPMPALIAWK